MTRPELETIAVIATEVPDNGVIVEIGSFAGRSSVHWAANSRQSVAIYCVDPFDAIIDDYSFEHLQGDSSGVRGRPAGELFAEHTRPWAERLTAVAQASPLTCWSLAADVVFIDGDHTFHGVTRDLDYWIDHLRPRGRLMGHDWNDASVREAVHTFADRRGLTARVHADTSIWELRPGART